jgi:hypothetical protein
VACILIDDDYFEIAAALTYPRHVTMTGILQFVVTFSLLSGWFWMASAPVELWSHLGVGADRFRAGAAAVSERFGTSPRCLVDRRTGRLVMGFGRGILLWLLGIPLPIIILLALFWHH